MSLLVVKLVKLNKIISSTALFFPQNSMNIPIYDSRYYFGRESKRRKEENVAKGIIETHEV